MGDTFDGSWSAAIEVSSVVSSVIVSSKVASAEDSRVCDRGPVACGERRLGLRFGASAWCSALCLVASFGAREH